MKAIEFILELQGDTTEVLWILFENPVTFHEDNQGVITITVPLQMWPRKKHIVIKYHHFRSFSMSGDLEVQHIYTK